MPFSRLSIRAEDPPPRNGWPRRKSRFDVSQVETMKCALLLACLLASSIAAYGQVGVFTSRDVNGNLVRDRGLSRPSGAVHPPGINVLPHRNGPTGVPMVAKPCNGDRCNIRD
jgi:hypothetical protein